MGVCLRAGTPTLPAYSTHCLFRCSAWAIAVACPRCLRRRWWRSSKNASQSGPEPDRGMGGVSWQGNDPSLGPMSGTWEVTLARTKSSASGPALLLGIIDCLEGLAQTSPALGATLTGSVARDPAGGVDWRAPRRSTTAPEHVIGRLAQPAVREARTARSSGAAHCRRWRGARASCTCIRPPRSRAPSW